jgi:hypothetical protein
MEVLAEAEVGLIAQYLLLPMAQAQLVKVMMAVQVDIMLEFLQAEAEVAEQELQEVQLLHLQATVMVAMV